MLEDEPVSELRPHIPVTLIAVDTGPKKLLTERAIKQCEKVAKFEAIKFLTDDSTLRHAVKIPAVKGIEGYSEFCIRELHKHFDTSHCLLIQWDGYVLNPSSWLPAYLEHDYIGAPWQGNVVGNGGFSLRSKRLCQRLAGYKDAAHPEDNFICRKHRGELEASGFKFAPAPMARQFSIEAATYEFKANTWVSDGRGWNGQFGFHSYLTPLGSIKDRPLVFHHSGDIGDIIYSLAAMKAMGGGVMYVSPECRYPYPRKPNLCWNMGNDTIAPLVPLLRQQDYVWDCRFTSGIPASTDVDFNAFREFYRTHRPENFFSLYRLHLLACGVDYPETDPWLTVDFGRKIDGRPIIVNRTPRYRNARFPWASLITQRAKQMAFVGLRDEYNEFCKVTPAAMTVPYVETPTLLDLARVIKGSSVFVGNQSSPMAIALGLGKNVVVEEWLENPNIRFRRPNAIYVKNGVFNIPKEWLE